MDHTPPTGPTPSRLPSLAPSNNPTFQTGPAPSSPPSFLLSATTYTPFNSPTAYPSMVQYYIIFAASVNPPRTYAESLPFHIKLLVTEMPRLSPLLLGQPYSCLHTLCLIQV